MRAISHSFRKSLMPGVVLFSLAIPAVCQSVQTSAVNAPVVPQTIKYDGVAVEHAGGKLEVAFRIYPSMEGGEPLWSETQSVSIGADGKYSVFLGADTPGGLPQTVFVAGQARWLGISIAGAPEQTRVPWVSVAYAMKAADAETLGGLPVSAFMRTNPSGNSSPGAASTAGKNSNSVSPATASASSTVTGSGRIDYIPMWTGTTQLGTSIIFQAGGNIGVGITTPPGAKLDAAGTGVVLRGISSGKAGAGVFGSATSTSGSTNGVTGEASSTTSYVAGVNGYESASTGLVFGVNGNTNSTGNGAAGVNGWEGATTGLVYGVNGGTLSSTNGAAGVTGYEGAKTGYVFGVSGFTTSSTVNAAGVIGNDGAATGQVYGVSGLTYSAGNFAAGVGGYEGAATGQVYGVIGDAVSATNNSVGVYGNEEATTGQVFGVFGAAASTTTNAAGVDGLEYATTGQVFGVSGGTSSTGSGAAAVNGYEGAATGRVFGVAGNTASSGDYAAGVWGNEGSTTGNVYGVWGGTVSPNGVGVFGVNNSTTGGTAVSGIMNATSGQGSGVFGSTNSPDGTGVSGVNNSVSGQGIGVLGTSAGTSTGAAAVKGIATDTTGQNYGVVGTSYSVTGYGVFGSSPYKAVAGWSQSCSGGTCTVASGIAGEFITGVGGTILSGSQRTSDTITQVFSVDSDGDGVFAGNLTVLGNVSKGGGSFKIDHPLDPANKYLSHSFVESPDMMNVYNGNITTDKHGLATVVLPGYFGALNRDFRYQLTVIGQFAQAIVAEEIENNRFVIRTSKPGVRVSWQVTGIRQDAYANADRIPVEEDKPPKERGLYLHPEVFGQPADKSVTAAVKPVSSAEVHAGSQ